MSFLTSLLASAPLALLRGTPEASPGAALSTISSRAPVRILRALAFVFHFSTTTFPRSGRPVRLLGIGVRGAHDRGMGVTAFVVQVVLPVGDADVLSVVLALVSLVHNRRHRGVIEPSVENDRFWAFAHPVANLAVIRLAFLVVVESPRLFGRNPILDRVQLLKKLFLHNVSSLNAFPTLGPQPFVGLPQVSFVAADVQSFLALLKFVHELLTGRVAVVPAMPNGVRLVPPVIRQLFIHTFLFITILKYLGFLTAELVGRHRARSRGAALAPALGRVLTLAPHDHQMVLPGHLPLLFLQKRGLALVEDIVVLFAIICY